MEEIDYYPIYHHTYSVQIICKYMVITTTVADCDVHPDNPDYYELVSDLAHEQLLQEYGIDFDKFATDYEVEYQHTWEAM
jgi:hypothetical protein